MIDEFAFPCAERVFDTRVVPAIPPTRHAAGHPLCREQLLVCRGGILAAPIRVVQHPADRGAGREIEDSCERARQLSVVQTEVRSPAHTRFGRVTENWRTRVLAATGIR